MIDSLSVLSGAVGCIINSFKYGWRNFLPGLVFFFFFFTFSVKSWLNQPNQWLIISANYADEFPFRILMLPKSLESADVL